MRCGCAWNSPVGRGKSEPAGSNPLHSFNQNRASVNRMDTSTQKLRLPSMGHRIAKKTQHSPNSDLMEGL